MFAGRHKSQVTIGSDVVRIRKLSENQLDQAEETASMRRMERLSKTPEAIIKLWREQAEATKANGSNGNGFEPSQSEAQDAKREARYLQYDRATVLRFGIEGWSDASVKVPEGIRDLETEASDILWKAILDLSLPPIDKAEAEAQVKHDSGASINS